MFHYSIIFIFSFIIHSFLSVVDGSFSSIQARFVTASQGGRRDKQDGLPIPVVQYKDEFYERFDAMWITGKQLFGDRITICQGED